MFTGIVTATGTIISVDDRGDRVVRVGCSWPCNEIAIGASIAHSGICLTVISRDAHSFDAAASAETVNVTTLAIGLRVMLSIWNEHYALVMSLEGIWCPVMLMVWPR